MGRYPKSSPSSTSSVKSTGCEGELRLLRDDGPAIVDVDSAEGESPMGEEEGNRSFSICCSAAGRGEEPMDIVMGGDRAAPGFAFPG